MGELPGLILEPSFPCGDEIVEATFLAEVVVYNKGRHICRSAIHRKLFETDVDIQQGTMVFTVLEGMLSVKSKWHMLSRGQNTRILEHSTLTQSKLFQIVEACAGIGAMGEGFKAAGAKTVAYVESNEQFVRWLRKHKSVPVIHDDVSNLSAVEQVHSITGGSTIVTAGVACQPFSKLGDRREHEDPRSGSFGGTLQLAFLTRAPLIILECTQEVFTSKWAQDMLHNFANQAGYRLTQQAYSQASLNGFDMIQTTPELTVLALIDEVIQSRDNLWHVTPTPYTEAFVREMRILLDPEAFPREPPAQVAEEPVQQETSEGFTQLMRAECERIDPASVSRSRSPPHDRRHGCRALPSQAPQLSRPVQNQVGDNQARTGVDVCIAPPVYASNGGLSIFARHADADAPEVVTASHHDTPSDEATVETNHGDNDAANQSLARDHHVIPARSHEDSHSDTEENTSDAKATDMPPDHPSFAQDHLTICDDHGDDRRSDTTVVDDASPHRHGHDDTKSELGENQMLPESDLPSLSPAPSVDHEHREELIPSTCAWEEATTVQIWIGHKGCKLVEVHVPADSTVGGIAYAEQKITRISGVYKPTDAVGSMLDAAMRVEDKQIIMLRESDNSCHEGCPARSHSVYPPQLQGMRRIDALWNQLGWVAEDEMMWYLRTISEFCQVNTTPPVLLNMENIPLIFGRWVVAASAMANQTCQKYVASTVVWHDHHWFPVQVQVEESLIRIITTHQDEAFVKHLLCRAFGEGHQVECTSVSNAPVTRMIFPADCGFQALAWIMCLANHHEGIMYPDEALKWRILFAQHVRNQSQHEGLVSDLLLGGMPTEVNQKLQDLLTQHGVSSDRVASVVQHLHQHLGSTVINRVMSAPQPWKDLKARASAMSPPYQLVHSDELQQQIDRRASQGTVVGKKSNKRQQKATKAPSVTLLSTQVIVPDGLFKQADGVSLSQISLHQVQQRQKGVVLANIKEAEPFFRLQDKICREGLALIVLDLFDPALPERHQVVQFPAICADTKEPMIIQGALFQLGHMDVTRAMPKDVVKVSKVDTKVVRVMVHRDQFQHDWTSFARSPVKAILALPEFQKEQKEGVLDVFDRQFMTKRFQKSRPDQAELFSVNLRLVEGLGNAVLNHNATGGIYYEPRSDSGRHVVDLWEAPLQELYLRLTNSWQWYVASEASSRQTFANLHLTCPAFTMEEWKTCTQDKAYLRSSLNGSFFTADHLNHRNQPQDDHCPLCGEHDHLFHRNWECTALDDLRGELMAYKEELLAMPQATFLHGWFPLPEETRQFHSRLLQIPDTTGEHLPVVHSGRLEFFTDGSCKDPTDKFNRFCSWGVVLSSSSDYYRFQPLSQGLVPGILQTVVRAELMAVQSAIRYALKTWCSFRIWVDNQFVCDTINSMLQGKFQPCRNQPNHDMLASVASLIHQAADLCVGIVKVVSHQQQQGASAVERWAYQGNDAADFLAGAVFARYPVEYRMWHCSRVALAHRRKVKQVFHKFLVDVGKRCTMAVKAKAGTPATEGYLEVRQLNMSSWYLPDTLPFECQSYQIPEFSQMKQWIDSLHQGEVVQRWSFYQLVIDGAAHVQAFGPWYQRGAKQWQSGQFRMERDLQDMAKSLSLWLNRLTKRLGIPLPIQYCHPTSSVVCFGCQTVPVLVSVERGNAIDAELGRWIPVARKPHDLAVVMPVVHPRHRPAAG
eukprot:Skav211908  [mRNA]  locus=scaffold3051:23360:33285:+ [translate_table: standard]